MIDIDTIHSKIILRTVPDRYEIGSCGFIVVMIDEWLIIILFIP